METIIQWDKDLFNFFNHCCYNDFMDAFMLVLTDRLTWIPLYVTLLYVIYKIFKQKTYWILLAVGILVAGTDLVSTKVFKNNVERWRPCREEAQLDFEVRTLPDVSCSKYGFVSSHAANTFGLAVFIGLLFFNKKKWPLYALLFWASLVTFSRLYLGLHYPLDLLAGAMVGSFLAILVYFAFKKFWIPNVE